PDAAPLEAAALILATPAPVTGTLVAPIHAQLGEELLGIPYASTAIVLLGYRREQIEHSLDGFGFVVPEVERRRILAASFSSLKFRQRAPEGQILVRVFLGGAAHPDVVERSDDELRQMATDELRQLIGARGEPTLARVVRWRNAMPQYHLGHVER